MTATKSEKNFLLHSDEVLQFCQKEGIDLNKLRLCRIEKMFGEYVFGFPKKISGDTEWYLHEDLSTQPDIVLIIACNSNRITVRSTDKTYLIC